jgi:hypothetical protein
MTRNGPRKYDPLTTYLGGLAVDQVTLTFAEVEEIVGAPLPPSAWRLSFWSTTAQSLVARPWLRAGWRVLRAELHSELPRVTFQRVAATTRREPTGR